MVLNVENFIADGGGGKKIPRLIILGWLLVVCAGLFVPLMDNDAAHHANIALRMFLTGDYVNLIDYNGAYLDKPHLHFWLSALSYHVFGVTGFAYKFPSLIFSVVGIWGVYRAGTMLVHESCGRVAGVVYATSVAFLLGLNDVRMDAILTASTAITFWQLAGFIRTKKIKYVLGVALGMAIGFSTKGHVAVLVPGLFLLLFCFFEKNWRILVDARWLLGVVLFFLFIAPVVYCYYLQYNLHPELIVRGQDHINGVRFILWDQTLGRYSGEMGADAKGDRFFFFHTFLWAFAPWSVVGVLSLIKPGFLNGIGVVSKSVMGVLFLFGLLVGFSSFKLPHYLNIIMPIAALWVADRLEATADLVKRARWVEWMMWVILGLFSGALLIWWFPVQPGWFWVGFVLVLVFLFYTIKTTVLDQWGLVTRVGAAVVVMFWLLNAGFYPNLLFYQGGNQLADRVKKERIEGPIYTLSGCFSSSFYFYTETIRREVSLEKVNAIKGWLMYDIKQEAELGRAGVKLKDKKTVLDYEITKITGKFLNPASRASACTELVLARIGD